MSTTTIDYSTYDITVTQSETTGHWMLERFYVKQGFRHREDAEAEARLWADALREGRFYGSYYRAV